MKRLEPAVALFAVCCLFGLRSLASDAGTQGPKTKVKAPPIEMPTFTDIPKAEDLKSPTPEKPERMRETPSAKGPRYSVVKVEHARAFRETGPGLATAAEPLQSVELSGSPLTTKRFATLVRVKSAQRLGAPIQVAILDPRGEVALSSTGELSFRGLKGDEANYLVDWAPTPCRTGGDYRLTVRVSGEDLGSWPLKFINKGAPGAW
jgi:hypothetical protein